MRSCRSRRRVRAPAWPLETFAAASGPGPWLARIAFALSMAAGATVTCAAPGTPCGRASLDINVLMLIAAAGAMILDQWSEAAAVIFLFAVAQALEARTLERARRAISALMDLTPADALVRDDAGERRVDVERSSRAH